MTHSARPVAICNYDFRSSGTVVKSIEIAEALKRAGLPIELWVIRSQGALKRRIPTDIAIIEIGDKRLRSTSRSVDLALNIPALASMLRQRTPSILLSGGNHFHLPARCALALSGQRHTIRFGVRVSNSSRRGTRNWWNDLTSRLHNRLKVAGADFSVAVSTELAQEVAGVGGPPVQCIANGVDVERVTRLAAMPFEHRFFQERDCGGPPVIVAVGRICHQKGFDILIRALARLRQPERARLLIIGDGPKAQVKKLRSIASREGVDDSVEFLGYLDNPFSVMRQADLFVSASRWEGASNTLLEALTCGLPLVATDCPTGNREVITQGPFGTIAATGDVEGLARAIATELKNCRSREVQKKGARNWALQDCLNAWKDLLDGHHRAVGIGHQAASTISLHSDQPYSSRSKYPRTIQP